MKLKEFYREIGSSYADVTARLGNEEFVRYFVLLFKDDKSFEELKESLKKGLAADAFRAAHTLKGVAANLGFSALYENAAEITEALRGGDLNIQYTDETVFMTGAATTIFEGEIEI